MIAERRRSLAERIWRAKHLYLYLLPGVILLAIFNYYPPISAFYHAFFRWDGITNPTFVGLDNFRDMFSDPDLSVSIANMFKLVTFSVVVGTFMPILVAELIFNIKNERNSYFWRLVFVIQVVIPGIVTILLWQFILDPDVGLLNTLLSFVGLGQYQSAWLGDYHTALYSLMMVGFPYIGGANVLIALAGLQGIPESVLDACRIDGCQGLRRVWSIDVPHLLGQIRFFVIFGIIGGIQNFTLQLVLTSGPGGTIGGPGTATLVPAADLYAQAFTNDRFGYACAIGLVMFLVIMALTVLSFGFMRSQVEFEGRNV